MRRALLFRLGVPLAIALMVQSYCGCQDNAPCPGSCPAAYAGIYLGVTAATDGGAMSSVEATLSGPTTVTMSCESRGTVTDCIWPSAPLTTGNYSLQVTAPGFQSANVSATLAVTHDPRCGCDQATLQPSAVTLDPS